MTPPTLQDLGSIVRREHEQLNVSSKRSSNFGVISSLIFADSIALIAITSLAMGIRYWFFTSPVNYSSWLLVVLGILIVNACIGFWRGAYPGYGNCTISELRSIFYTITTVFASVIAVTYFMQKQLPHSAFILSTSWVMSVPAIYIARSLVRKYLSNTSKYGTPVIVVGQHQLATRIVDALRANMQIGLRPLAIVEADEELAEYGYHDGVPIIGGLHWVHKIANAYNVKHAILAMPNMKQQEILDVTKEYASTIHHFTVINDHIPPTMIWISNSTTGFYSASDIENRLQHPQVLFKKRLLDLVLTVPAIILLSPVIAVIAIAVAATSRGGVLYWQDRVGKGGKIFRIAKFRTMVVGAHELLAEILDKDEDARQEYATYHKLRKDPRVTTIGRFLRKYSLDELPQLFNIVRGDMSLVGSRPIMPNELFHYQNHVDPHFLSGYVSTKPGATGLWQITVRAESAFSVRMHVDRYYHRNWSLFLDIYVIFRTVGVVLYGRGGY